MIDRAMLPSQNTTPFIFRFAQQIAPSKPEVLRYDRDRQIMQVLENGNWIDGMAAQWKYGDSTLLTQVSGETTDDN